MLSVSFFRVAPRIPEYNDQRRWLGHAERGCNGTERRVEHGGARQECGKIRGRGFWWRRVHRSRDQVRPDCGAGKEREGMAFVLGALVGTCRNSGRSMERQ